MTASRYTRHTDPHIWALKCRIADLDATQREQDGRPTRIGKVTLAWLKNQIDMLQARLASAEAKYESLPVDSTAGCSKLFRTE